MYVGTYEGTYHPALRSNPSFAKVLPNKILLPSQGQNYMCCGLFFLFASCTCSVYAGTS